MNNDKLDALIKRIASEHGIVLTKDDPVLMMHTLNEALLEQNEKAHAELLNKYQEILENSFNQWTECSIKKSNAILSASVNNANISKKQLFESCTQMIHEKIRSAVSQEIYELTRISRQAAIMNLLASILVLLSAVIVSFMLL
ncbi:conjugal transfer protein TraM [Nitrosomonas aestuarii]|uniref:conjugal transfer protein TraM n=1 Tax=Nitrosomonas aestuarii TaxID=52441 RepID=UPI000D30B99F|nr:conjugal transfer protein TraM [Nitrosomonas aestuarii]PTN12452.1 transcriptional activator TraM [Nitrosomonas aestuarii]